MQTYSNGRTMYLIIFQFFINGKEQFLKAKNRKAKLSLFLLSYEQPQN